MPKKKIAKKITKPYSLEVEVNGNVFKTKAKSLKEALTAFVESPEFPVGAKTIAFIKYSKGKKEGREIWQSPKARRIFRLISLKPDALAVVAEKFESRLG